MIHTGPATKLKSAAAGPEVLKIDLGLPDDQGASPARFELSALSFQLSLLPPYGPLAGELRLQFTSSQDYTLTVPFAAYVAEP